MQELVGQTLLGRYAIKAFLGRGGMAEVYRAHDTRRGIDVALKLLREDLAEDPVFVRRFQREAIALERLAHPNIVRFYGFEQDGPLAFIVMEFIDGTTLRRLLLDQKGPMPSQRVLEILEPVCRVLDYAHAEGVIHRDIKPANIMVEKTGRVVVSDFGIARLVEGSTTTGNQPGTPAYMSPEQCLGRELDGRSDLYSLGITLYGMVTGGERPFTGETDRTTGTTSEKVIWQHIHDEPPPPSHYNSRLSIADDRVVLRALAKRPEGRYQTALEMLEAMRSSVSRTGGDDGDKGERRKRLLDWLTEAEKLGDSDPGKALELAGRVRASGIQDTEIQGRLARVEANARRTTDARDRETKERARGEEAKMARFFEDALAAYDRRDWARARAMFCEVLELRPLGYERRGQSATELMAEVQRKLLAGADQRHWRDSPYFPVAVVAVIVVAICVAVLVLTSQLSSPPAPTTALARAAAAHPSSTPEVAAVSATPLPRPSPTELPRVVLPTVTSTAEPARALTFVARDTLSGHTLSVQNVAFSPDGKILASASYDKTVRLWDVTSGRALSILSGHLAAVESVAFSPDGKTLASGSDDYNIRLWDVTTGKTLSILSGHKGAVWSISFSSDGKTLASGSYDKTIKLWDVANGKVLSTFSGHDGAVEAVAFSPDGKTLASGSYDTTIKLWDVASGKVRLTLSGHDELVGCVAFSPDGKTLASGSGDNSIRLWDVASGKELFSLNGDKDQVSTVAFSPDGKTLASGGVDRAIKLWDVASGQALPPLSGLTTGVLSVAFSPDGRTLASAGGGNTITLWESR